MEDIDTGVGRPYAPSTGVVTAASDTASIAAASRGVPTSAASGAGIISSYNKLEVGSSSLPVGHSVRMLSKNRKADDHAEAVERTKIGGVPSSNAMSSNAMLLQRLDAFLPQLRKANDDLAAQMAAHGADSVNIESVAEEEAHILMDVAIAPVDSDSDASGSDDDSDGGAESAEPGTRASTLIKELD